MTSHPKEPNLPESLEDTLRLLAASMRHSAGQWMVPGWDGHKVADLLQKAESALKARDAEIERLRGVISDHNADCESQCERRQQSGDAHCPYAKYGRQCPDCPRDGMLDPSAIDQARATGGEKTK
ncbi:hypothetical protein D9M72_562170 [compost metagenome]